MTKERLRYFDMLKGLAIFLVVMGHVLILCVRGIDRAPAGKFIGEIHMPIFFFISGWLASRCRPDGTGFRAPAILPKVKRLLLPMVLMSSLWIFVFPATGLESPMDSTFGGLWADQYKNGYWFTLVLFEIFVLYAPLSIAMSARQSFTARAGVAALVWITLMIVNVVLPADISNYLSFSLTSRYFGAFAAGVLAARYSDRFGRLCADGRVCAAALIGICAGLALICWPWKYNIEEPLLSVIATAVYILVAILGIAVVKPWSAAAFAPERSAEAPLARMWEYIGKRSLAIYLLHYFFLFPLGGIRPALEAVDLALVPLTTVAAVGAAIIIAMVLCADYILRFCGPLAVWFLGDAERKPQVSKT